MKSPLETFRTTASIGDSVVLWVGHECMLRELWLSHLQTLGRLNSLRCGPTSKVLKEQVFLSSGLFEGALATTESLDFCSLAAALHPSVAGCTLQMLSEKQGPCQRLAALKTAAGNVFHCYLFSQ